MINEHNLGDGIDSIVSTEWLAKQLGQDDIVIADCRFELADPGAGRRAYDLDHVPGALFFDLERDLSRPARQHTDTVSSGSAYGTGGRHPLPSVEQLTALFGGAGIGEGVTVVCYDDQKGGMAARLWWMLRYLGHRRVVLLDGGYAAWRAAGYPVTSEKSQPARRTFVPRRQPHMMATMDDVRQLSDTGRGIIIDSRAPERYRGEVEPLDPVAGHIPGAVNMPWEGNVDQTGTFLAIDVLAKRFEWMREQANAVARQDGDLEPEPGGKETNRDHEAVIVHCGSGVTGCLNVLGMERAGVTGVKLYVGGWSDWCSHSDNPIATGTEPVGTGTAQGRS